MKMSYSELRHEIHQIFYNLLEREIECSKGGEFDYEFMECRTDDILKLIRQQGGII